jgi:hypothetical protein
MTIERTVQQCRWAEPTLFLDAPWWLMAWDFPWSCQSAGTPAPVNDTAVCAHCVRWAPRLGKPASPDSVSR